MKRTGQVAVTDLFISIAVFIILMTIITLNWDQYNLRLNNRLEYEDMIVRAFQISDDLIKNKGNPANWQRSRTMWLQPGQGNCPSPPGQNCQGPGQSANCIYTCETDIAKLRTIGLASTKERVLNYDKVACFTTDPVTCTDIGLDYDDIKELFSINQYEFYMRIREKGTSGVTLIDKGILPTNQRIAVNLARYVYYDINQNGDPYEDEEQVVMEFVLWKT